MIQACPIKGRTRRVVSEYAHDGWILGRKYSIEDGSYTRCFGLRPHRDRATIRGLTKVVTGRRKMYGEKKEYIDVRTLMIE